MPAPRRPKHDPGPPAASALLAAAPLVARWMERLLAQVEPPLTLVQYDALRAIADAPLTAAELALRTGVSGPAVSQLLATLVAARWVERHPLETDRRRQELSLTSSGEELVASIERAMTARLSDLIGQAPAPELDALTRALPFVRAALAGTPLPRRPHPPGPPGKPAKPGKPGPPVKRGKHGKHGPPDSPRRPLR
ncbi:MAG: MarR family transcriptional regulator [Conexibacteraceae bacterium]|nr:MarR family transcriptional regulator [Conexibacteraceae bacterium]